MSSIDHNIELNSLQNQALKDQAKPSFEIKKANVEFTNPSIIKSTNTPYKRAVAPYSSSSVHVIPPSSTGADRPMVSSESSLQQVSHNTSNVTPESVTGNISSDSSVSGMTLTNPPKGRWRLTSIILWVVTVGALDGSPGALLPRIEEYYNINYTVVSLIWMSNAVGFILVALFAHKLEKWLTKQKLISYGCIFQLIMNVLISPGSKFALVVVGFFFGGVGNAIGLSQHNIYMTKFENASYYLGLYHGGYGLGATVSPLIATAMVDSGIKWSYFYLILLALSIVNFFNMWLAFQGCNEDLKPWDNYEAPSASNENENNSPNAQVGEPITPKGQLHFALRNIKTWLVALFVFFYQGAEAGFAGWIVTFLEAYRGGSKSSTGYIVSGFWGGLTIGRLVLTPLSFRYTGCKRGVFLLIWLSILCSVLIWVINVIGAEAAFIALCGLFVGPVYPLMISVSTRILPRKIQFISLTIMTAFGSSGGAIFPFIIGLISQHVGAFVVLPFFIGLFTGTAAIWVLLPNPDRNLTKTLLQRVW